MNRRLPSSTSARTSAIIVSAITRPSPSQYERHHTVLGSDPAVKASAEQRAGMVAGGRPGYAGRLYVADLRGWLPSVRGVVGLRQVDGMPHQAPSLREARGGRRASKRHHEQSHVLRPFLSWFGGSSQPRSAGPDGPSSATPAGRHGGAGIRTHSERSAERGANPAPGWSRP